MGGPALDDAVPRAQLALGPGIEAQPAFSRDDNAVINRRRRVHPVVLRLRAVFRRQHPYPEVGATGWRCQAEASRRVALGGTPERAIGIPEFGQLSYPGSREW